MAQYLLSFFAALVIGVVFNSSIKVVSGGDQAIVEGLNGRHRTLKPGVRYILPFLEKIVHYDTTRERFIDIKPQEVITGDNTPLTVDAVVFWKIEDIEKSYYEVEQVEDSISNLVLTTLRAKIATIEMRELFSSINEINDLLLKTLDEATGNWGIKVIRVNLQSVTPPAAIMKSMEQEKAAENKKRAEISIARSEAEAIEILSKSLQIPPNSREFIQYMIAKQYVEAHHKLSASNNSKIIFMNPGELNEAIGNLMEDDFEGGPREGSGSRKLKIVKPEMSKKSDDNIGNSAS
ncbi:SPFH domain-containing protein [Lyngbya sp. PCC 8106]|uniref:SPFH domain-containing protein n=1 Tax=Lyngbya sp. (strain PCC 8106) TaxID=313612 RepID=UPI0000EAA91F|nr:stomatin-like protein [Lyngbya sp. PCC 8106]EAW37515.1 Band 7 protein [Lyngbya sp. PCC 8106]